MSSLVPRLVLIVATVLIGLSHVPSADAFEDAAQSRQSGPPRTRYLGKWVDGTRLAGDSVGPWNDTNSSPELAGRALFDKDRPIRWLLDDTLALEVPPSPSIELVGGDVMPGRVVGAGTGIESPALRLPPYLEVVPGVPVDWPDGPSRARIRVHATWVRRVVWQPVARAYQPQMLFCRDGRRLDFRAVRFATSAIQLLRADGVMDVSLEEVGELHMPRVDSWEAYFHELAALSTDGLSRLVQVETSGGLRATSSAERFQARARGAKEDPNRWYHLVQPAWSLDAFWLQHRTIRLRRYFSPGEVPLSRIEPSAARHEAELGGPWPWRADRNVEGGPLVGGGQPYAWGFGVHAAQELEFLLPPSARSFRTWLGLDQIAREGGYVRARVFLGDGAKPAYEKPSMIGSAEAFDTGRLVLGAPGQSQSRLLLQVDSPRNARPFAADPLGIRAQFDWLEPLVELDAAAVRAEVFRCGPRWVPAWQGWKVSTGGLERARLVNAWDEVCSRVPVYRLLALSPRSPLTVASKLRIGPNRDQLLVAVWRTLESTPSKIELRVDGEPLWREGKALGPFEVPTRRGEKPPEPWRISLEEFHGRQVHVELVQRSSDENGTVQWDAISLGASPAEPAAKAK